MFDLKTRNLRKTLGTESYLVFQRTSKSATRNCEKYGKLLTSASISIRAAQRRTNLLSLSAKNIRTQREQTHTWAQLSHAANTSPAPKPTPCGLGASQKDARCRHWSDACELTNKNNAACSKYISILYVPLNMILCLQTHQNTYKGKQ